MNSTNVTNRTKSMVSVSVDTVAFSIEGAQFELPGATVATVTDKANQVIKTYGNRMPMTGKYGAHRVYVRTMDSGKTLQFEGSPFAYLHGQNVFTSSRLLQGCRKVIRRAFKKFEIAPSEALLQRLRDGDIDLQRVDLAVNFRLGSEEEVLRVLKQIGRQLNEHGRPMKRCGSTVMLTPRNGIEDSIAFYAKGPQMRQSQKYEKLPGREELLNECENMLRVEIRLRSGKLRQLGLNKAKDWKRNTASRVFELYMAKLRFLEVTSGPLNEADLNGLSNPQRIALALHKSGVDLSMVYTQATLKRRLAEFKEMGIDLRCPNQPKISITRLSKYLSRKKVINDPPQWMLDKELVPFPPQVKPMDRQSRRFMTSSGESRLF